MFWMFDQWQYYIIHYFHHATRAATAAGNNNDNNHIVHFHWMEGTMYPLTILGLLLLSTIWFQTISRGLKKQTFIYIEAQQ